MSLTRTILAAMLLAIAATLLPAAQPGLVVHEWGTFTALQSEQGKELSGVNVDDEPVPDFVHNLGSGILRPALLTSRHWRFRSKQAPRHHPEVFVRLETPVIYFYPPAEMKLPLSLDVHVRFRGGWLTEFYPSAHAVAPGVTDRTETHPEAFRGLTPTTNSSLSWVDLRVGTQGQPPATEEPVWTAPRRVNAAMVTAKSGESEKYLFYRGVANQRLPLRVSTDLKTNQLSIRGNFNEVLRGEEQAGIRRMWLVQVRPEGTAAFRTLDVVSATADPERLLATTSGSFAEQDFKIDGLGRLKAEMQAELVAEGLFADEAVALLTTWDRAYFRNPGLRLFFMTPRKWTDHYMPLSISHPATIERVMVGRVELITAEQRKLLARIAAGPVSSPNWIDAIPEGPNKQAFDAGRSNFGDLGVAMPQDYRDYMALGRFRNALATWYARQTPADSPMWRFIGLYSLQEF